MTVSFSFLLFHSITSPHPTTLDVPSLDDVRLDIPHCVYAYPQLTHPLHQREHAIDDVLEGYQEEGVEVSQVVEGAVLVCEVRIDGRQGGLAVAGEGHDGSQVGEEGAGGVGGGGGGGVIQADEGSSGHLWGQTKTVAHSGRQWQTVAGSGRQWKTVAGSGRQWQAVSDSGRQWQTVAHSGTQWQTVADSGRQWQTRSIIEHNTQSDD